MQIAAPCEARSAWYMCIVEHSVTISQSVMKHCWLALQLVHCLGIVEDIFDKAIGFVLNELAVLEGDHASAVLTTMLQHQQTLINLNIDRSLQQTLPV